MTRVFYIEDEPSLGKIVSETLQQQGFEVLHIADGARVLPVLNGFSPDICVVDIMLPNVDGYTLCAQIKGRYPNLPVIFLTAKTETADLVKGFEAGGTDYIRKPFSMEELIVRINNQLKISGNGAKETKTVSVRIIGQYKFYPMRYELETPTTTVKLSQSEQELLSLLTDNLNQPVERRQLLLTIWGDDSYFNSRNLDVYIRKLRGYFAQDPQVELVTLKGKGYVFLVR
jgi:DNA-binding response OmpR family regulator